MNSLYTTLLKRYATVKKEIDKETCRVACFERYSLPQSSRHGLQILALRYSAYVYQQRHRNVTSVADVWCTQAISFKLIELITFRNRGRHNGPCMVITRRAVVSDTSKCRVYWFCWHGSVRVSLLRSRIQYVCVCSNALLIGAFPNI